MNCVQAFARDSRKQHLSQNAPQWLERLLRRPTGKFRSSAQLLHVVFLLVAFAACRPLTSQQAKWHLGNDLVHRTIAFNEHDGLYTKSWLDVQTNAELVPPAKTRQDCQSFKFSADDQTITGRSSDITLEGSPVQSGSLGTTLDLSFKANRLPLRLTVHYSIPKGFAAVRQWLTIENVSSRPITLRDVTFECDNIAPGPAEDLIAFGGYGQQPRELFFTGRVNDVAVLMENSKTGTGFAALNEAPGYLKRTELSNAVQWESGLRVMYDTDLFPFERRILPGESFTSAVSNVVLYQRGTANDPHWIIPEYVERVIAHNSNELPPRWLYNNWEPRYGDASEKDEEALIPRLRAIGLDLNTLDEGWEETLGDNSISKERFPNKLKPLFEADGAGIGRGLWLPVALVSKQSETYKEHPEWVCRGSDGKPKESQGEGVVMCLASDYKRAALERISTAIEMYRLDYVKLDLTTVFNTYGEQPGCFETGHEHQSSAESSVRIYETLQWLAQSLHERFPNLLIDYTFELWGEKHLIDYGLLRVADLDWLSNVNDPRTSLAGPLQARTLLYQRSMAIPVEDMLIGNLRLEGPDWEERIGTAMAASPILLGNLDLIPSQEVPAIRAWIDRFRLLRNHVALNESFFPLGAWRQPNANDWDGYGRFSRTGEGLVTLFRNQSSTEAAMVVIPGIPDGNFTATDWDSNKSIQITGRMLRDGWRVPLKSRPKVLVFSIRKN